MYYVLPTWVFFKKVHGYPDSIKKGNRCTNFSKFFENIWLISACEGKSKII